jgi:hypothetical protein
MVSAEGRASCLVCREEMERQRRGAEEEDEAEEGVNFATKKREGVKTG